MKLFHAVVVALTLSLANCECDSKEREMLKSEAGINSQIYDYEKQVGNFNVNFTQQIRKLYRLMNFTETNDVHFPFIINFQYAFTVFTNFIEVESPICDQNIIQTFLLFMNSTEELSLLLYGCNLQTNTTSMILILSREAIKSSVQIDKQFNEIASTLKPLCKCSEVSTYISKCLRANEESNYQIFLWIIIGHVAAISIVYFVYNNRKHKWECSRRRSTRVHVMPQHIFIN